MQMTGDPSAKSYLKQAMQDRQNLLDRTDEPTLKFLTVGDFDAIVPYGARVGGS